MKSYGSGSNSALKILLEFLLLLLLLPPLVSLALNTFTGLLHSGGGLVMLGLLVVIAVLSLQFRSAAARIFIMFAAFCFFTGFRFQFLSFGNSFWFYVSLAIVSIIAYLIRASRLEQKSQTVRLQGVERTPVLPPEIEER